EYQKALAAFQDPELRKAGAPKAVDRSLLADDTTLEALARRLGEASGSLGVDSDELSGLLRGVGQYKRGGGGDRGRLLALWEGSPWAYRRVTGGINILIGRPTVVICGGLQVVFHHLLGSEGDGLRARWLPHLAEALGEPGDPAANGATAAWTSLLRELLARRNVSRQWRLSEEAARAFADWRTNWKTEAREGDDSQSVSEALSKAD